MSDQTLPPARHGDIRCPCGVELRGDSPAEKRKDIDHLLRCHLTRSKKIDLHFVSAALAGLSEEVKL